MGNFCLYFHRTWTPGYNSECIDPNLAYAYQKKLNLAKKVAWWIFVLTLIVSIIILLVTLSSRSSSSPAPGCQPQPAMILDNNAGVNVSKNNDVILLAAGVAGVSTMSTTLSSIVNNTTQPPVQSESSPESIPELSPSPESIPEPRPSPESIPESSPSPESSVSERNKTRRDNTSQRADYFSDCEPESFICDKNTSEPSCIPKEMVCDIKKDCESGQDEANCTTLSDIGARFSGNSQPMPTRFIDPDGDGIRGHVLVRMKGSWHPYCNDTWTNEMGLKICEFLGYKTIRRLQIIDLETINSKLGTRAVRQSFLRFRDSSASEANIARSQLWVLKEDADVTTKDPIEDIVLKSSANKPHNCSIAEIECFNSNSG